MSNFDLKEFAKSVSRDRRTLEMFRYLVNHSYIRVVNYHNTNDVDKERMEEEIKYFSKYFTPVTRKDLDLFFETKKWPHEKPGLIVAVFEGYRSHFDIMRPILDKYNFTGWFYIPSFLVEKNEENQVAAAKKHHLRVTGVDNYPDGRIMLNWNEIKELSLKHEICCHTGSHYRIEKDTEDKVMHREIVESKRLLEEHIGRPVDVFCWLHGEEYNYNIRAHKHLEEAGYKYVLSNLKMEKIK